MLNDTNKMLRTIINGQSAFRQEMLKKFDQVDKRFNTLEKRLTDRIDGIEKVLTERLDKIGKQLAYLEDDTPTREEFDGLDKRVKKLEQKPSYQNPQTGN